MSTATATTTPGSVPIRPLSLYHLTEELAAIEHALLESGSEITDEMEHDYADPPLHPSSAFIPPRCVHQRLQGLQLPKQNP